MARPTVLLAAALAIALVLPLVLSAFYVVLLIEIAVAALFATAFNLLMGFGGMVSFGHAAYFALGAYAAALLAQKAEWPMLAAFAAAPLVAAFGALIFGFFIVRLTHTYFAMLSLAFAQILYTIIFKWTSLTGGDNGLLNVWPPAFLRSVTPKRDDSTISTVRASSDQLQSSRGSSGARRTRSTTIASPPRATPRASRIASPC